MIPARREIPEARETPESREFPGREKFEAMREGGNGNFPLNNTGVAVAAAQPAPDSVAAPHAVRDITDDHIYWQHDTC